MVTLAVHFPKPVPKRAFLKGPNILLLSWLFLSLNPLLHTHHSSSLSIHNFTHDAATAYEQA